jgi:dihydrofolate reductase
MAAQCAAASSGLRSPGIRANRRIDGSTRNPGSIREDVRFGAPPSEAVVARARELAGDRIVEVAAGEVGGQVLAEGLVDEVRMDVASVVLGAGKRFLGCLHVQHLLADPDVVTRAGVGCFA